MGADYTELRNLLASEDWLKADLSTTKSMLWAAKRDLDGWLSEEDIKNFPPHDLITINKLWLAASNGKFGFSVQKQIWIDICASSKEGNYGIFNNLERFIEKVEWSAEKIIFDSRMVRGHLPIGLYVKLTDDIKLKGKYDAIVYKNLPLTTEKEAIEINNSPNNVSFSNPIIPLTLIAMLLFYSMRQQYINLNNLRKLLSINNLIFALLTCCAIAIIYYILSPSRLRKIITSIVMIANIKQSINMIKKIQESINNKTTYISLLKRTEL